ncbi:ABC transporter ATP-binding protein [Methylobacterium sp. J-001]|uniref:metal ABC transporter ATP-binding protein n=1 Tax=Methylobacterium sp. J-001 TaxID=2836609 RepID=UPI001FBADAE0|nr:ABC transporter ATP-binding protein [Methylobacterium sp. J-001]MCJ2120881.1 ABC transporter ATP-binding protein [Methylobacterium sp. J-001]
MSIRPTTQDAFRLVGLTLGYDRHPAVHHLSGVVRAGDLLALVGPNGAGKSTLLKGMAGEIPCLEGHIDRFGTLAYMPQADEIDRSFPLSVMDLAGMGLWRKAGSWRGLTRWRPEIGSALDAVGLGGFEARPISTLSGGQFRRALFARLILQDCPVVLLDEPFTGIDNRTVEDLLALIRLWHGQGRTVVAALHDLTQVREHFPTTLLLAREPVAWGPTARVLTAENLVRARNLSEAWDEGAAICGGPRPVDGHDHGSHGLDTHHHEDAA